jgi:hypothetical protein
MPYRIAKVASLSALCGRAIARKIVRGDGAGAIDAVDW